MFTVTDGAVQGRNDSWDCPECGTPHSIPRFTAFLSIVRCCGRVFDLQNWSNPYAV